LLHHLAELLRIGVAALGQGVNLDDTAFDAGRGEIGAPVGISDKGDTHLFGGKFPGIQIIAGEAARSRLVHRIKREEADQQGSQGHGGHTYRATAGEAGSQRGKGALQALPERFRAGVGGSR